MTLIITNYQLLITNFKVNLIYFILLAGLVSCSSIDLPTVEESDISIAQNTIKLNEIEKLIDSKTTFLPEGSNIEVTIRKDMINRILSVVSSNRKLDLSIIFPKTKNLLREEKKVLGIEYTNYVDIDKGQVNMDLKTLKFQKMQNGKIEATIEIEGEGEISLSGKNTGIPASITSGVNLYLKDNVEFEIENAGNGNIVLKPLPKKLKLKTKFSIAFLKWNIPWREEIELEFDDIISPMPVPMSLATELELPIPAKSKKPGQFDYVPYKVEFKDVRINTIGDNLIWKANINIMNKK